MLYVVHDPVTGKILQANKVFDPAPDYDSRLTEMGQTFVKKDMPGVLPHEQWHVPDGVLTERPPMRVSVSKTLVKAGGTDAVVITGAPKDVAFVVLVGGANVWSGTLPDGELELSVPTPGQYRVELTLWPYQTFTVDIEAAA